MQTRFFDLEFLKPAALRDRAAATQSYTRRLTRGRSITASFDWTAARLEMLAELYQDALSQTQLDALGRSIRAFINELEWDKDEAEILAALQRGDRVQLRICSEAPEIYLLPFEMAQLEVNGQSIGLLDGIVLRYMEPGVTAARRADAETRGRALLAWAEPSHDPVPHAEHVDALATTAMRWLEPFDAARDVLASASLDRLVAELRRDDAPPVKLLHVLCHGAIEAREFYLTLARDDADDGADDGADDEVARIGLVDFASRLQPFADTLELVLLSVCGGANPGAYDNQLRSLACELHKRGVPAVIGSRFPLSKRGSVALSRALYAALQAGLDDLDDALEAAREALLTSDRPREWATLQLFFAPGEDDDRLDAPAPFEGPEGQAAEDRYFVGRADELRALEELLRSRADVAVLGPAGIGKTALVEQLVAGEAARRLFPGGARWLSGATLERDLARIARGLPDDLDPALARDFEGAPARAVSRLHAALCQLGRANLLVVDGVALAGAPDAAPLVQGPCTLLVLSRTPATRFAFEPALAALTIRRWAPADARDCLRALAPRLERVADAQLDSLVQFVDALPRELRHLARLLASRVSYTPATLIEQFRRLRAALTDRDEALVGGALRASVAALTRAELELLDTLIACPSPATVEQLVALTGHREDALRGELETLLHASLATRRDPPARPWSVSAYVRAAASGRPGVSNALARYLGWLNEQVLSAEDGALAELLTRVRELHDALGLQVPRARVLAWSDALHRRALASSRYGLIVELGELLLAGELPAKARARWLYRVGWALSQRGDIEPARARLERASELTAARSPERAQTLSALAYCRASLGDHPAAIELLERALALREELGDERGQAYDLNTLARCQREHDDPARALELHTRALELARRHDDRARRAESYFGVGVTQVALGRPEAAREPLARALTEFEALGQRRQLAEALRELGLCELRLDAPGRARAHLERARALYVELGDAIGEADARCELARCLLRHDERAQARAELERALTCYRAHKIADGERAAIELLTRARDRENESESESESGAPERARVTAALERRARACLAEGRHDAAIEALEQLRDHLGREPAELGRRAWVFATLSTTREQQGRRERAIEHAHQALVCYQSLADRNQQLYWLHRIAWLHDGAERWGRAARYYRLALELLERHPAPERAAELQRALAECLVHAEEFEEALQLFTRAEAYDRVHGDEKDQLRCALGIGVCRGALGEHARALPPLERVVDIATRRGWSGFERRARIARAEQLGAQGRFAESETDLVRALALAASPDHVRDRIKCLVGLAHVRYHLHADAEALDAIERAIVLAREHNRDGEIWEDDYELLKILEPTSALLPDAHSSR